MPLTCRGRVRGLEPSRGDIDDALGKWVAHIYLLRFNVRMEHWARWTLDTLLVEFLVDVDCTYISLIKTIRSGNLSLWWTVFLSPWQVLSDPHRHIRYSSGEYCLFLIFFCITVHVWSLILQLILEINGPKQWGSNVLDRVELLDHL